MKWRDNKAHVQSRKGVMGYRPCRFFEFYSIIASRCFYMMFSVYIQCFITIIVVLSVAYIAFLFAFVVYQQDWL